MLEDNTILEVEIEKEEDQASMALNGATQSTLDLVKKLQNDSGLRKKLDKVINILS